MCADSGTSTDIIKRHAMNESNVSTFGLFSPSGKTQYFCPKCDSPYVLGPIMIYQSKSIVCHPCAAWYQWTSRIKRSTYKVK